MFEFERSRRVVSVGRPSGRRVYFEGCLALRVVLLAHCIYPEESRVFESALWLWRRGEQNGDVAVAGAGQAASIVEGAGTRGREFEAMNTLLEHLHASLLPPPATLPLSSVDNF